MFKRSSRSAPEEVAPRPPALEALAARCKQDLSGAIEAAVNETVAKYRCRWRLHAVLEGLFSGQLAIDQRGNWWRWHNGRLEINFEQEGWQREHAWANLGRAIEYEDHLTTDWPHLPEDVPAPRVGPPVGPFEPD